MGQAGPGLKLGWNQHGPNFLWDLGGSGQASPATLNGGVSPFALSTYELCALFLFLWWKKAKEDEGVYTIGIIFIFKPCFIIKERLYRRFIILLKNIKLKLL